MGGATQGAATCSRCGGTFAQRARSAWCRRRLLARWPTWGPAVPPPVRCWVPWGMPKRLSPKSLQNVFVQQQHDCAHFAAAFSAGMLSMSLAVTLLASFSAGSAAGVGASSCSLRSTRGCAGAGAARSLTLAYSSDICVNVDDGRDTCIVATHLACDFGSLAGRGGTWK